jgi:hypothetical protein
MTPAVRVSVTMKHFAFILLLAACGPKHSDPVGNNTGSDTQQPPPDTRSEIEKRRDAACDTLGPRITTCAVEDAKAALEAGKVTKAQFDKDTASGVLKKNTDEFIDACRKSDYSSRQVRVLEVCQKEETECGPLLSCLDNLNKK